MLVGSHLLGASHRVVLFGSGSLVRDALRCHNVVMPSIVASSQLQLFRGEAAKTCAVAESTSADTPALASPAEGEGKRQPRQRKAGPPNGRTRGKQSSQTQAGSVRVRERRPKPDSGSQDTGNPHRTRRSERAAMDTATRQPRQLAAQIDVPRRQGVTDGVWDGQDVLAVEEALLDDRQKNASVPGTQVLLGRSREELEALAVTGGHPAYRGKQLYDGILKGARSLDDISNVPKAMRDALAADGHITGRSVLAQTVTAKDKTRKFLLQLHDGRVVEAVGIPNAKDGRLTACVSSQVGCPMRCTFCATGKGGFARNLATHEIVDQVLTVQEQFKQRVSNIVFMGMGEPLLNMRSVLGAVRFFTQDVGIGARHITISTVGLPNAIMKLASHKLQSTLAVSIHAPSQALREQLVPSAKMYPIEVLMLDCHKYFEVTGRRITFEYALMSGVNDSVQQAQQLAALLKRFDLRTHVNLIPWNPVDESDFKRPTRATVKAFATALTDAGVATSVRVTCGLDASAACGQLRNQYQKTPLPEFAALT